MSECTYTVNARVYRCLSMCNYVCCSFGSDLLPGFVLGNVWRARNNPMSKIKM